MARILVFVEQADGILSESSLEAITLCREIAVERGFELAASGVISTAEDLPPQLAEYGIARYYALPSLPAGLTPEAAFPVQALQAVRCFSPRLIVVPHSACATEISGAMAVGAEASLYTNVVSLEWNRAHIDIVRIVSPGGSTIRFTADDFPVMVSLRRHSHPATPARVNPATVDNILLETVHTPHGPRLRTRKPAKSIRPILSKARVVVTAGRGVRDNRGRQMVDELAAVLGAAVGATRGAVDRGLYARDLLVGQTGTTVSPALYIGIGVSGTVQHLAGITRSKAIVALNRDRDAPIFRYADYGLVGDLYDILPVLIERFKSVPRTWPTNPPERPEGQNI